ncbi:hypothetical protein Ga0102493_11468 [Erythrobacter litoralis]|jgi:hypothetical protein|uniref:hypothetical protein n=1 Tax=Erythrobacter TaxID=1041 RepID=UPI000863C011|nr:hypothetical protein [Erythrobacter litoralis]AOL24601.1 hypothetical protein Ga0102493_11468 [Erythrobacter litoralis]MEE4337662.1 hypothetical protein [Erythrobacter sp.]
MTRPRPGVFEDELERRLAILSQGEETDRRLPASDAVVLAAITIGSFAVVLVAQAL